MEQTLRIKPQGVCAREFEVIHDGEKIISFRAIGGCRGNLQGIGALLKGMPISEAISRLEGIECHDGTSCPDQIAKGLKELVK